MAEDKKKEVFVSYCTKNSDLAQYFCNLIEGSGITCWIAPRDIPSGGDWAENIVKGLSDCSLVAFLVSEDSVASKEVAKEIGLANSFKKDLLQVRLENASLPPAMLYHLSNKQWVDALGEEKSTRFNRALSDIRKLQKKDEMEIVSDTSIIGQARRLVNQLNKTHGKTLDIINTPISLQEEGPEKIMFFFPIRFGATGIDLIFDYNGQNRTIELYANGVTSGDPFHTPFFNVFIEYFGKFFPNRIFRGYRYKSIILIPSQKIPSDLVAPEQLFTTFKANVVAFSEQVLPKLLEWAFYADQVIKTINRLEDELRKVFPENEGWRVGALEGSRLSDLRKGGQINVYKENWEPCQDNYRGRGLLSFTVQCDAPYLKNVFIGILKYEPWHELGEWEAHIRTKANEILGQTGTPEPIWPWWQMLGDPWNNSGIADISFKWQNKLDGFVDYCLEKYKTLKGLEEVIENACKDIPNLQIKNPIEMPQEKHKWNDGLYVYNFLRLIAEDCNQKAIETGMTFAFQSRYFDWDWVTLESYLTFRIGNFDAAAAFKCNKREITVEFKNLEPPDFETEIIKSFIAKRGNYNPATAIISVSNDFDGKGVVEWLDRYASFVSDQMDLIIPEFMALKSHLERSKDLAIFVSSKFEETLGGKANGWNVGNESISLEKDKPISFWHESWLKTGAKDDDLPPLMFQIVPSKACFDDLVLSLRQNESFAPEFDHYLGMACGACEFAFGKGDNSEHQIGIWSTNLPLFGITGGSILEKDLPSNEDREELGKVLSTIASSISKMEPLITALCKEHNFQEHFVGELHILVEGLTKVLCDLFPEKDVWKIKMTKSPKPPKELAWIAFYKESWKKPGQEMSTLSLTFAAGLDNFDDLYYGIMPYGNVTNEQKTAIHNKMTECFGRGRASDGWPWWQHAEGAFRKTGGIEQKVIDEKSQSDMQLYFREKFRIMKEQVAPLIDTLLTETNEKVTQIVSSEVNPA